MSTTTANMGLTKPTVAGDTSVWGGYENDSADLIDAHNHTAGKGVQIPSAGININADLTFAGYAATNLKGLKFTEQASVTSFNQGLWVKSSDHELYWRNSVGTDVKITAGSSLNLSLVGGITGDYAAASASFYYDQAALAYRALQSVPLPNVWASVGMGDLYLYEKASGISNKITVKSPAALAASYTVTLPGAVPGTSSLLQMSTGGTVSYNVTGTRSPAFLTTLDVNSTFTCVTLAASSTVTATDFRYTSTQTLIVGAGLAVLSAGQAYGGASCTDITLGTTTSGPVFPLPVRAGEKLVACLARVRKTTDGTKTLTMNLYKIDSVGGAATSVVSGTLSTNNPGYTSFSTSTPAEVVAVGFQYFVEVKGSGTTGDVVLSVEVGIQRP